MCARTTHLTTEQIFQISDVEMGICIVHIVIKLKRSIEGLIDFENIMTSLKLSLLLMKPH